MRGDDRKQGSMWSYLSPEARVPKDHPLVGRHAIDPPVCQRIDPAGVTVVFR